MGDLKKFKTCWQKSIAAQLLLPNLDNLKLHLGKSKGDLASIAYLACQRGTIHLLDELFEKWEIREKGTSDFKGKLKENWLKENEEKIRDACNDTLSAISELSVATYLENEGYLIENIAAWGGREGDVTCEKDGQKFCFEIKYFSDSPELYKLRVDAAKTNGVSSSSVPNLFETLNYFYFRIFQSVNQLGQNCLNRKQYIFFVFDVSVVELIWERFIKSLNESFSWYQSESGKFHGILDKKALKKTPSEWLEEIDGLYIGIMDNWKIGHVITKSC